MVVVAAIGLFLAVVIVVGFIILIASRDDPMGLGRTVHQSFTRGLGTIFGAREPSDRQG
jgi:hypothetical protein